MNCKDIVIVLLLLILCDWVSGVGCKVYGVGKIGDIFFMCGIDEVCKGCDDVLMGYLFDLVDEVVDGLLIFVNFVEFDSEFGYCWNVVGYVVYLEWFSVKLFDILLCFWVDDLLVVMVDYGNDLIWIGMDYICECVFVLMYGIGVWELGEMLFVDVGVSVVVYLGVFL